MSSGAAAIAMPSPKLVNQLDPSSHRNEGPSRSGANRPITVRITVPGPYGLASPGGNANTSILRRAPLSHPPALDYRADLVLRGLLQVEDEGERVVVAAPGDLAGQGLLLGEQAGV